VRGFAAVQKCGAGPAGERFHADPFPSGVKRLRIRPLPTA
jgi:hypothetical protein